MAFADFNLTIIAATPLHLGARIGMTSVLRTWGSAMTHHPPHPHGRARRRALGRRRALDRLPARLPDADQGAGQAVPPSLPRWVAALHRAGGLRFFGARAGLADPAAFAAHLAPLRRADWPVYAKPPFGRPEKVLASLSRYTHRVAISSSRLVSVDALTVAFTWKDYRAPERRRRRVMRLATGEFIRRFLFHVLPDGFHRIRHYGLLASAARRRSVATIRALLAADQGATTPAP